MAYTKVIKKVTTMLATFAIAIICLDAINVQARGAASPAQEMQTFYHQPSYEKFILDIRTINLSGSDTVQMFATMVVDAHPQYAKQIVQYFPEYSEQEQQLLFSALVATNNQAAINDITKKYHYKNSSTSSLTAQQIKNLEINDTPSNLDDIWIAYFATGDEKYLLKIIKYINENTFILQVSNQLINNQYGCGYIKGTTSAHCQQRSNNAIAQTIKEKYPTNANKMLRKAAVVASALWSLQANSQQDPIVAVKIKNVLAAHSDLNYVKKINEGKAS